MSDEQGHEDKLKNAQGYIAELEAKLKLWEPVKDRRTAALSARVERLEAAIRQHQNDIKRRCWAAGSADALLWSALEDQVEGG